jgi:hypothetical protein
MSLLPLSLIAQKAGHDRLGPDTQSWVRRPGNVRAGRDKPCPSQARDDLTELPEIRPGPDAGAPGQPCRGIRPQRRTPALPVWRGGGEGLPGNGPPRQGLAVITSFSQGTKREMSV